MWGSKGEPLDVLGDPPHTAVMPEDEKNVAERVGSLCVVGIRVVSRVCVFGLFFSYGAAALELGDVGAGGGIV